MTDIRGFSHPLPRKNFPAAIAKAIRKIEKCNLHSEMGAPAEWEEKLAPPNSVSTFLIENCHNSSRSFTAHSARKNIRNVRNTQYCGLFSQSVPSAKCRRFSILQIRPVSGPAHTRLPPYVLAHWHSRCGVCVLQSAHARVFGPELKRQNFRLPAPANCSADFPGARSQKHPPASS